MEDAPLVIPFSWEEKPGVPKQPVLDRGDNPVRLPNHYRGSDDDHGYDRIDGASRLQLATSLIPPLRKPPRMEAAAVLLRAGAIDTKSASIASHGRSRTASALGDQHGDRRIVAAAAIASRPTHKSSGNTNNRPKLINIKDDPFLLAIQACINSTNSTTFIRSASSSSLSHDRHRYDNPNPYQYNNPYPNPHHNNIRYNYHRRCNTDMLAAQSSSSPHHQHQHHLTIAQLLSHEKMLELEEDNNHHHQQQHQELTRHMQREPLLAISDTKNSLRMIRTYKSQLTLQLRHHRYDNDKPSIFTRCFGCIL